MTILSMPRTDAPLDERFLEKLIARLGGGLVGELLELFLAQAETEYRRLAALEAGQDLRAILDSAHTLRGMAANIGCHPVTEHARAIEALAKEAQDMTAVRHEISRFVQAWPGLKEDFQRWRRARAGKEEVM